MSKKKAPTAASTAPQAAAAALTGIVALTRAREAKRPARAAWAALRLPAALLFRLFFLAIVVCRFGATLELGRSGRSMVLLRRRRASAVSYGVIDNRSENLQH